MIEIKVPEGESLEIRFGDYTIFLCRSDDGHVVMDRWINGVLRTIKLDPAEDSVPLPHPSKVSLDRNLTIKRLPLGMAAAETLRAIILEQDPETGARSVLDIAEGDPHDLIRCFNQLRKRWLGQGACEARLEVVPPGMGGH